MSMEESEYERQIDELYNWFVANENLPKQIDRTLLRRFYQCMYFDLEGTKNLIELNYAMRNKHAHIFLRRDPHDADSVKTFEYADMVPLPGLTPEKYKVCCYRLCDYDPQKVHHTEDTKAFFMVTDCRFTYADDEQGTLAEGEVQIFDMCGYTMRHVRKLTISTLRIYLKFLQDALPVRLKAIHIINCPTYLDRIVNVLKPFISKEVFKLIHFHTSGIEALYNYVPQDMLPEEYGGKAGKISELKVQLHHLLEEKREYLMDSNHWKIDLCPDSATKRWFLF